MQRADGSLGVGVARELDKRAACTNTSTHHALHHNDRHQTQPFDTKTRRSAARHLPHTTRYGPADATATPNPHHLLPHLIQTGFDLLVPAYLGCPGKEAVNWV